MSEPILSAQLERAKRDQKSLAGRGFLVTPDNLTEIKRGSLNAKGIVHIRATLSEFTGWLTQKYPHGLTPKDVVSANNRYDNENKIAELSMEDVDIARSLRPISLADIRLRLSQFTPAQNGRAAREFLRGVSSTWEVAASNIPVWLQACNSLYERLASAIDNSDKLLIITGQSGSGKTTATKMCLLRYLEEHPEVTLYEVISDVRSIQRVFQLLRKIHDGPCIVYVADLFLYGDGFKEDLEQLSGQQVTVVSTARSGEWREHFVRYLGSICNPFQFQRFVKLDYEPLIERLIKYVPAPRFKQLSKRHQLEKLAESKSQLLIALREATESQNFTDIITNEFENLPDDDTKKLCMIVGIATLARVGISLEMASEVYVHLKPSRSFDKALDALDGIVNFSEERRLVARHELYVRHVIENVASFSDFKLATIGILKAFTKYEIPIIRNVNRRDAFLFKFILNHAFVYEHANEHGVSDEGRHIYENFEIEFELDGHYWLQYGLYLVRIRKFDEALQMLRRSIQAFPDNPFAAHALAHLKLRIARHRATYDATTRNLIGEAVEVLLHQHARAGLEIDQYPIVTLANGHIAALVKHGQVEDARKLAIQYFDRLQQMEKNVPVVAVTRAKEKMFKFATLGEWTDGGAVVSLASANRRRISQL